MKDTFVTEVFRNYIKMVGNNGRFFSVTFIKRTDNTTRHMVCRLGVKKGITGTGMKFDPVEKGLLPVFDVQKRAYRSIPLENILQIEGSGHTYKKEQWS